MLYLRICQISDGESLRYFCLCWSPVYGKVDDLTPVILFSVVQPLLCRDGDSEGEGLDFSFGKTSGIVVIVTVLAEE